MRQNGGVAHGSADPSQKVNMPTYVYRCDSCGNQDEDIYPIGTAPSSTACTLCLSPTAQVLGVGVHIGADALPNKRAGVTKIEQTERGWSTDMDAYKRMRGRGLQPKAIDGSAGVEDTVGDQMDIDHARAYTLDPAATRDSVRDRIVEGYETAAQIRQELDV